MKSSPEPLADTFSLVSITDFENQLLRQYVEHWHRDDKGYTTTMTIATWHSTDQDYSGRSVTAYEGAQQLDELLGKRICRPEIKGQIFKWREAQRCCGS